MRSVAVFEDVVVDDWDNRESNILAAYKPEARA